MADESFAAAVASFSPWMQSAADSLRQLVHQVAPHAEETVKWSQPVFASGVPVCFLQAHTNHLNFGFFFGARLDDPAKVLEGSGKQMRHVKIHSEDAIPTDSLVPLIEQAFAIAQAEHGG